MRCRFLLVLFLSNGIAYAQSGDTITAGALRQTLACLTADSLKGRGNYSPELLAAARYIGERFRAAGLDTLDGGAGYYFPFAFRTREAAAARLPPYDGGLMNVVGLLRGKSKPAEFVIFSAHYDHIGASDGAVFNGANDNASGTAALIMLAEYFAKRGDNARTILFCAFAGEELGLLGSKHFARLFDPAGIVAAINIEMIGRSTIGSQAFFLTGAHLSDMKRIFARNLGKRIRIRKEPDFEKMLFQRSDNLPFAELGIAAHTIMASDDDDPCYHRPCDDLSTLDVDNMATIVKAIATASATIISGKDTPRRINVSRIGMY